MTKSVAPPRPDQPIEQSSQDQLGFSFIADGIAQALVSKDVAGGLVLGIDGPWGSGKSSLLNLIIGALATGTKDPGVKSDGPSIVRFEPWQIGSRPALIAALFEQLVQAIDQIRIQQLGLFGFDQRRVKNLKKELKKQVRQFGRAVTALSTVAALFDPTGATATAVGGARLAGAFLSNLQKETETLEKLRAEIRQLLVQLAEAREGNLKFVVVIEDLDRLEPTEALEMLRLVKSVADFPYVTYVLAYDRPVLAKSIEVAARVMDGNAYLDKIIQFTLKVPPPEPFQLRNWFKSEIQSRNRGDANYSSQRAEVVFGNWAGHLIETPRDVNRIITAVSMMWPQLRGRGDLLDLIWLEMIKEKAASEGRDLYGWVRRYLVSLDAIAVNASVTGKGETQNELTKILNKLGWRTWDGDTDKIDMDFHNLDQILAGVTGSLLSKDDEGRKSKSWIFQTDRQKLTAYRDEKRLSSPWHWRYYFTFSAPSHALTDDVWDTLKSASERSLGDLLKQLKEVFELAPETQFSLADQILDRVNDGVKRNTIAVPAVWLRALVDIGDKLESRSPLIMGFVRGAGYNLAELSRQTFKKTRQADRDLLITSLFRDGGSLWALSDLYREQHFALRDKESPGSRGEKYWSEEELDRAGSLLAQRISALTFDAFAKIPSPWTLLYAWRDATSTAAVAQFLRRAMINDADLIRMLSTLKVIASSNHSEPHFPADWMKTFVSPDELKTILNQISESRGAYSGEAKELLRVWDEGWGGGVTGEDSGPARSDGPESEPAKQ